MSILVVGSVALDTIETPAGKAENALGGSATYFSLAASFFYEDIRLVAVVGEDFSPEHIAFLTSRKIDLTGLQRAKGKTFHWSGRYIDDLNKAETLLTELNVYGDFAPKIPENYQDAEYVFLANIGPELQLSVVQQIQKPKLIVCDTMNFWIDSEREALLRTLQEVDILLVNDAEAKSLAGESNLIKAGERILAFGPQRVIIKKGEHGAVSISESAYFSAPAYPLKEVFDPTGAGDSFAGGFMGYVAATGDLSEENIRRAIVYGSVIASFNVEDFSLNRQRTLTREEIERRFAEMQSISKF